MTERISPLLQAMNLIRYIGDWVLKTGRPIKQIAFRRLKGDLNDLVKGDLNDLVKELPYGITKEIGTQSTELTRELLEELQERRLVRMVEDPSSSFFEKIFLNVTLSLDGWDQYEAEKRGELSGDYGFLARKFNDPDLDMFVCDVLRPTVEESTGYKLHDMNDVSRAGVIDNIISELKFGTRNLYLST